VEDYDLEIADLFERIAAYQQRQPFDKVRARFAAIKAYENGSIGAVDVCAYLESHDLWGDPDYFVQVFAAGLRVLASREGRK
jgi:hypothetical protein